MNLEKKQDERFSTEWPKGIDSGGSKAWVRQSLKDSS